MAVGQADGSGDEEHGEEGEPGDAHPGDPPRKPARQQTGEQRQHDHEIGGAVVVTHDRGPEDARGFRAAVRVHERVENHDREDDQHDDLGPAALFEDHAADDPDDGEDRDRDNDQ